jgi:glycosyltransferase involved in cell wall biosynthesis
VWKLEGLSLNLVLLAQRRGVPTCYHVGDRWLARWDSDWWYRFWHGRPERSFRRALRPLARHLAKAAGVFPEGSLNLLNVQFVSQYLKEETIKSGKPVTNAEVIHWGIDVAKFPFKRAVDRPSRLLFLGRFSPEKGLPTLIEAMRMLVWEHRCTQLKLTLLGGNDVDPQHCDAMKRLVSSSGLDSNVEIKGSLPREELPNIYGEHDILVFPSTREAFGITILEAMSSGLVVVGTATGGSAEIMKDEVNSLVFPRDNPEACAAQILRLMNDPNLYERLRQAGRRTVEEKFQLRATIDRVERSLLAALTAGNQARGAAG